MDGRAGQALLLRRLRHRRERADAGQYRNLAVRGDRGQRRRHDWHLGANRCRGRVGSRRGAWLGRIAQLHPEERPHDLGRAFVLGPDADGHHQRRRVSAGSQRLQLLRRLRHQLDAVAVLLPGFDHRRIQVGRFLRLSDQVKRRSAGRDDEPDDVGGLDPVQRVRLFADPINAAVNFGTIRTGINLSASQVQELYNAVGFDVSQAINAAGYYLDIKDAPASTRVARQSPPMTLYYTDGGSVQALSLASIEVQ